MPRGPRHRPLPQRMFQGGELLRLVSLITMLGLIVLLMVRFRDPGMWRWLTGDEAPHDAAEQAESPPASFSPQAHSQPQPAKSSLSSPTQSASPAEATGKPPTTVGSSSQMAQAEAPALHSALEPSGPTDQDPEEWEAFQEERQALEDFTFFIQREEMEAYDRLVRWSVHQPFELLWQRAHQESRPVVFNDFVQDRNKLRGKLVYLDLHLRRVLKMPEKTRDGFQLYEAWGFTHQSGGWLYSMVLVDLPPGLREGDLQEHVRAAGYFLKLISYQSGLSKPGDRPLYAPVIIGRVMRVQPPAPVPSETQWLAESPAGRVLALAAFVALAAAIAVWQFRGLLGRRRRRAAGSIRPIASSPRSEPPITVEEWLDEATGRTVPRRGGIAPASDGLGASGRNGHGQGPEGLFDTGLDTGSARGE